MSDFFNNIFWVVLGGVLFFFYENIQIDRRAELEAAHGYHIQRAGIASFQDFVQKQEESKDAPEGDFVLQDRLSDWRTWMKNKDEHVPHEFAQKPEEKQLTPIEEAQARLRELEQSVEQGYDPEAHTPVPMVDSPLSMKEILDRQGIEVKGIINDEPLLEVNKGEPVERQDAAEAVPSSGSMQKQEENQAEKQEEKQADGQQISLSDLFAQPDSEAPASASAPASDTDVSAEKKEEIEVSKPVKTPSSISGEKVGEESPLPKFLIIGSTKCSTSALLRFLMVHPELRSPGETYFFNKHYDEGIDYYKSLFEKLVQPGIILFDKSPTYYTCVECPKRIKELDPDMKIIMSVCDPVHRIVSRYYHAKDIGGPKVGELGDSFEDYQKNIILAERNTTSVFDSLELNGRDRTTAILEELYIKRKLPFKLATLPFSILLNSAYSINMMYWLRFFPKEQIFLVNGNRMSDEPFNVLGEVEEFLGIERYLVKEKFITNEKTGFFCFDRGPDSEPACLSDQKVCS